MTQTKRPALPQNRPLPKHRANGFTKSNALTRFYGHDIHEPMDADDRADLALIAAAAERGYRIAVQCVDCGHWLTARASVAAHRGPRCIERAAS
jgi:hypothetical protein